MWKVSRGGTHLVYLAIGTVPDDFDKLENPRRVLKFWEKSWKYWDECEQDESHPNTMGMFTLRIRVCRVVRFCGLTVYAGKLSCWNRKKTYLQGCQVYFI